MGLFANIFGKKIADQITPQEDSEYNDLLRECMSKIEEKNQALVKEFSLGSFEQWGINQEVGELVFSSQGVPKLLCEVVILGSYSNVSETCLWGWANQSLLENLTKETFKVKEYGLKLGISDLIDSKTEVTETEAWDLGSYACRILGGKGLYKGPTGNGFILMMLTSLRKQ